MWNLLQFSDSLDLELSTALADSVSVTAWRPQRRLSPPRARISKPSCQVLTPTFRICDFPVMRGYTRFPLSRLVPTDRILLELLLRSTPDPEHSPLICTVPYFAGVAERWPGPVVYWLTDLIAAYSGADRSLVIRSDRRMCQAATLICPNSKRLANYLHHKVECDPAKIHVLPNAVRVQNLTPEPLFQSAPLPAEIAHLERPVAGVIGNMAGNHDWVMLEQLIDRTPEFSWLFVGPTGMPIDEIAQSHARDCVMHHPRCTFIGNRPYAELVQFSRALDVAVLPYARREPTFSGSSTRFYEHLAACRPMIAFPGVSELLSKQPLVSIADSAQQAASLMADLQLRGFDDGLIEQRWHSARSETWLSRAQSLQQALAVRLGARAPLS